MDTNTTPTPTSLPWHARLAREGDRTSQERADRHARRADLLREGLGALGSQQALADHLGITKQAVSKDIRAERPFPRMIDYLELGLPATAAAVPTATEWEQLPEAERTTAARHAVAAWDAVHLVAARQVRELAAASEAIFEALVYHESGEEMAATVREHAPGWEADLPIDPLRQRALATLLEDLANAWKRIMRDALQQIALWRQRAGEVEGTGWGDEG